MDFRDIKYVNVDGPSGNLGGSAITAAGTALGAIGSAFIVKADANQQRAADLQMNRDTLAVNRELGLKAIAAQSELEKQKLLAQVLISQQQQGTQPAATGSGASKTVIIAVASVVGIGLLIGAVYLIRK